MSKLVQRGYSKTVVWRGINGESRECWHFPWRVFGFTIGTFKITKGGCE